MLMKIRNNKALLSIIIQIAVLFIIIASIYILNTFLSNRNKCEDYKNGINTKYYNDGSIKCVFEVDSCKVNGYWLKYFPNKKLKETILYSNDNPIKSEIYDSTGQLIGMESFNKSYILYILDSLRDTVFTIDSKTRLLKHYNCHEIDSIITDSTTTNSFGISEFHYNQKWLVLIFSHTKNVHVYKINRLKKVFDLEKNYNDSFNICFKNRLSSYVYNGSLFNEGIKTYIRDDTLIIKVVHLNKNNIDTISVFRYPLLSGISKSALKNNDQMEL
jgi:hypothetical protein